MYEEKIMNMLFYWVQLATNVHISLELVISSDIGNLLIKAVSI